MFGFGRESQPIDQSRRVVAASRAWKSAADYPMETQPVAHDIEDCGKLLLPALRESEDG